MSLVAMDTHSAGSFVRTVAGEAGLKPVFKDHAVQPCTNPITKEILVTKPQWSWTDKQAAVWRGEILHETGHWHKGNKDIMQFFLDRKTDMRSLYGTVANIFSDWVNDQQWIKRNLEGAHRDVQEAQNYHCGRGIESLMKQGLPADDKGKLLVSVFAWTYCKRADTFQSGLTANALRWAKYVAYTSLSCHDDELQALHDGQSIHDLIVKIFEQKEMEEELPENKADGGSGEEGQEGEPKDGESKGSSKDGKGEGDEKDSEEPVWVSYRDLLADDHSGDPEMGGTPIKIIYDHDQEDSYIPFDEYNVHDLEKEALDSSYCRYSKAAPAIAADAASLSKQVQRLIQIKAAEDREVGMRSGRIHARSLYKVPTGGDDVFWRKNNPIVTKNSAIFVLGDASGSMRGLPYTALAASYLMLNEATSKLGIPAEYALFSEMEAPDYYLIKKFGERVNNDQIIDRMGHVEYYMGNNPDGEALIWAARRLLSRPEKRKILLVLSDGQPATGAIGDAHTHLIKVAAEVSKRVDLFGIGLMTDSVKAYYKQHVIVNDPLELDKMFLNILRQKIIG